MDSITYHATHNYNWIHLLERKGHLCGLQYISVRGEKNIYTQIHSL